MANYTVVRTDNLAGIIDGSKLRTVRFYNEDAQAAIENGSVVVVGGIEEGSRDVRVATAPAGDEALGNLALIASSELMYEGGSLDEFTNPEGATCLAYILCTNDEFSITAKGFTSAPAKGKGVKPAANAKWEVVASAENGVGEIIAEEFEGGYTYYVIHIN